MSEANTILVAHDQLTNFCTSCFQNLGLSQSDAELTSRALIWANLRGVDSHGVVLVKEYAERLRLGRINPRSSCIVVSEGLTTALIDAAASVGQVAGVRAMTLALEKASQTGVGVVGVKNSNHFGAAAFYSLMAVERDMIGFATTNAPPTMAPWGGKARLLGNNPLSIAVPAGKYPPLVLDMATGASAWGKIFLAQQQGRKIPLTWALDKNGEPTDDPGKAFDGGFIQPIGGYKGYGLSLMLDVLAGVLTGSGFSTHIPAWNDKGQTQQIGHFMAAFRIDCFMPAEIFRERVDALIRLMKDCPPAPGSDRVLVPGEIEYETEQQRRAQGIPIHSAVKHDLVNLGQELGVVPPF